MDAVDYLKELIKDIESGEVTDFQIEYGSFQNKIYVINGQVINNPGTENRVSIVYTKRIIFYGT